jgi:polyhydroxybutyrate depolymerase
MALRQMRQVRLMRVTLGLCLALLTMGMAGCRPLQRTPGPPPSAALTATTAATYGDHARTLVSGGLTRTYLLHVPSRYDRAQPAPLLLALHGRLGDGAGMVTLTHLNQVADQYGFLVAYPDGYQRSWADGRGVSTADKAGVDDVTFLSALITTLAQTYTIDQRRIYVTGVSNGGFMAQRLGCDLANRIAAIAVDAATFPVNLAAHCAPAHPLPVLLFNGTSDLLVPYQGGVVAGERGDVLSAPETAAQWAALAHCAPTPATASVPTTVSDGTSVSFATYSGCAGGVAVRFYTIAGGGHTWPGGTQYLPVSVVGRATRNLDASQTLWQFVSRFTLPT